MIDHGLPPPDENDPTGPNIFIAGSKVTIVDGPYFNKQEFFETVTFKKNWRIEGKNGPHPRKFAEKFCEK